MWPSLIMVTPSANHNKRFSPFINNIVTINGFIKAKTDGKEGKEI